MTPPQPFDAARTDITALRSRVSQLRATVETTPAPSDRTAVAAELSATRDRIRSTLQGVEPTDLFAALDAHVPLALLPVRLETRFSDPGSDVLQVRIFPDDIHVDGHDPEVTDAEAKLGSAMWAAPADLLADGETPPSQPPAPDTPDGRRARWSAMVRLLGGPRAAWVAHTTRPVPAAATAGAAGATAAVPAVTTKPQAYVRPAVARALPDRWLVRAFVGTEVVAQAWTSAVGVDLHLAPDPQAVPNGGTGDEGLPSVDPEMRWLLDYKTAVSAGMAVDVPLPAGTQSLDRVVAVGVRATSTPTDASVELDGLLTAHRYTDGLGFLAAGSPTANTPASRSAHDRSPDPDLLWLDEFGPAPGPGTAAAQTSSALGAAAGVLGGCEGSADTGDALAHAMQAALWSATWGYYLGELLDASALGSTNVDDVRGHYVQYVRGRGTLPILRVGRQPYGMLPILPLDRWVIDGANTVVDAIARLLTRVRPLWRYGIGQPLTASEGSAFDAAFTKIMSTDAVGRSFQVRSVIADRSFDPVVFTGIDANPGNGVIDAMIANLLSLNSNPLVLDIFSPTAEPVRAPLVVDPTDPTPDATVQAAIRGLAQTNPQLVMTGVAWERPRSQGPTTVLHTLLRRSLLLEYAAAGIKLATAQVATPVGPAVVASAVAVPTSTAARAPSSILQGLSPAPAGGFVPVTSLPSVIASPASAITGGMASGEWLWRNTNQFLDQRRNLDQTLSALGLLATRTANELDLLLRETLDTATHRWTAWAESIAADKLGRLRSTTPTGITLGGWGVVERLTRRTRVAVGPNLSVGASSGPLWEDLHPGGFVHAPSTAQAATAAVLRAAHLAHGGENDPTCALDLSSGPARVAVRLVEGIRSGQELGALLGYELEQFLHDNSADALIAPLRSYAPRWKASGTFIEGDPEQIVSPSAVVDGLALADDDPNVVAQHVLPTGADASPALATALAAGLDQLHRHQDALADLLTSEAVHQVLAANSARANAALDAAHRGALPPAEFDVLRTPRPGTSLTCRIGMLLPAAETALVGGWPTSVRSAADAACATWLANHLPAMTRVRIRVADTSGTVSDAELPAAAAISPLDAVLDSPEVVRTRVQLALAPGTRIVSGRDPGWTPDTVGLDELLTVAADLREVFASRGMRRNDLMTVGTSSGQTDERDGADLHDRLTQARATLQAAADHVTASAGALAAAVTAIDSGGTAPPPGLNAALADARAAILSALGHGVVLQLPDNAPPTDMLAALNSAGAELTRRLTLSVPSSTAPVDDLAAALKGLLGAGQPAVPRISLDTDAAAAAAPGLVAGDTYLTADPEVAADWLDDVGAVRAGAGRLVAAIQGCDALTAGAGLSDRWRIIEPSVQSGAWTATLGAAALAELGPVATLVARGDDGVDLSAGKVVSGLLVDEWVEVVPDAVASTSVAYQGDAPAARAPQAILLGVAPDVSAGWNVDTVVAVVLEALDQAKLRTVDAETGAWFGRMLPAVLLPDGDANDVIAAPTTPLIQVDASVMESARAMIKDLG
jgi:hypothetical protein